MSTTEPDNGPNEDILDVPGSWGTTVDPRRGGHRSVTATPAQKAAERTAKLIDEAQDTFASVFGSAATERRLATEVRAYLDGAASPVGAAATVQLVEFGVDAKRIKEFAAFADVWATAHGIDFAAAAVAELARSRVSRGHGSEWRLINQQQHAPEWVGEPVAQRLRTLLTTVNDANHAAAVAEIAARRDREFARIVAAYLAPPRRTGSPSSVTTSLSPTRRTSRCGWCCEPSARSNS
ncbi:hypothetical protein [Actinoalloteichus hymeniacidonis]|nr:hypothetical protein [Actinoalloteichus hymeniacidonis]MBB5907779.1 prolyl-tRNA editing enzyme YbaK/EbsC (Cys-tRNA(Pro) deacylase) [Actinoalloteichus hymeniacidonis]